MDFMLLEIMDWPNLDIYRSSKFNLFKFSALFAEFGIKAPKSTVWSKANFLNNKFKQYLLLGLSLMMLINDLSYLELLLKYYLLTPIKILNNLISYFSHIKECLVIIKFIFIKEKILIYSKMQHICRMIAIQDY